MDGIINQVAQLTDTVCAQQKLIESNERERKERNIIVWGISECSSDPSTLIKDLCKSKLGISDDGICTCKRLGKQKSGSSHPRPILVAFDSVERKQIVMRNRTKLAGTNIFLNYDLTKEQMQKEKELRAIKRMMMKDENFKQKKITIFRGKLWANKELVSETDLQSAGILDMVGLSQ